MKVKILLFSTLIFIFSINFSLAGLCYTCYQDQSSNFGYDVNPSANCSTSLMDCNENPNIELLFTMTNCECVNIEGKGRIHPILPKACTRDYNLNLEKDNVNIAVQQTLGKQKDASECNPCGGERGTPQETYFSTTVEHTEDYDRSIAVNMGKCNCKFLEYAYQENLDPAFESNPECYICDESKDCYQCRAETIQSYASDRTLTYSNYTYFSEYYDTRTSDQGHKFIGIKTYGPACKYVPSSCTNRDCLGDTNGNDLVDAEDLVAILNAWLRGGCDSTNGCCGGADQNGDGQVDIYDYGYVTLNWGLDCSGGPPVIEGDL